MITLLLLTANFLRSLKKLDVDFEINQEVLGNSNTAVQAIDHVVSKQQLVKLSIIE